MSGKARDASGGKTVVRNKRARFEYEILETIETGIELLGAEVKSLREGRVNLADAYVRIEEEELFLVNLDIEPYSNAPAIYAPPPRRKRRLLVHGRQLGKLHSRAAERGLTMIPLSVYFNERGWAKVEVALVRGKTHADRREAMKKRSAQREISRAMKGRNPRDARG